jgi:hypothetical protein
MNLSGSGGDIFLKYGGVIEISALSERFFAA